MLNLALTMDELAEALLSENVPNVYAWPAESVSVPCAVVGYPTSLNFDGVMGRGADTVEFPVYILVGKANSKAARDRLSGLIDAAKVALDSNPNWRATRADLQTVTVGSVEYLGAVLTVEVSA